MTPIRRSVRLTVDFFVELEHQLPEEREPEGRPSRSDFEAYDLLEVVERFATGWDELPELIAGRPQYRLLVTVGRLIPRISVIGQLAPDGAVELVSIDLDLEAGW